MASFLPAGPRAPGGCGGGGGLEWLGRLWTPRPHPRRPHPLALPPGVGRRPIGSGRKENNSSNPEFGLETLMGHTRVLVSDTAPRGDQPACPTPNYSTASVTRGGHRAQVPCALRSSAHTGHSAGPELARRTAQEPFPPPSRGAPERPGVWGRGRPSPPLSASTSGSSCAPSITRT